MKQLFVRCAKLIFQNFDYIAIAYGLFALINAIYCTHPQYWTMVLSSLIALYYIGAGAWLFLFRKARFDWTLVYGKFIHKVVALVILIPMLITCSIDIISSDIHPTELVSDDSLYKTSTTSSQDIAKESPSSFWAVYYHFIDPGNQHISTTPRGRQWSALIAILGIFMLNGLLVTSLIGSIDNRKNKWLTGDVRYSFLKWRRQNAAYFSYTGRCARYL